MGRMYVARHRLGLVVRCLAPPQVSRGGRVNEVRAGDVSDVELSDGEVRILRSCARAASVQVSGRRRSLWGFWGGLL